MRSFVSSRTLPALDLVSVSVSVLVFAFDFDFDFDFVFVFDAVFAFAFALVVLESSSSRLSDGSLSIVHCSPLDEHVADSIVCS